MWAADGADLHDEAGALFAHHRQDGTGNIHRTEQQRVNLIANLFRAELLEEPREEVPSVVNEDIDPIKPVGTVIRTTDSVSITNASPIACPVYALDRSPRSSVDSV